MTQMSVVGSGGRRSSGRMKSQSSADIVEANRGLKAANAARHRSHARCCPSVGRLHHRWNDRCGEACRVPRGERCAERCGRPAEDQARDHHHAGEPVIRQLLRDVSGRRRLPAAEREDRRLRARSADQALRAALPRHPLGAGSRWPPQHVSRCLARHQPRQDERVLDPAVHAELRELHAHAPVRDGVSHQARDSELLDARAPVRPRRSPLRAEHRLVAARTSLLRLGLVGQVRDDRAVQLRAPGERSKRRPLLVDAADVPAAQAPCQLVVLRRPRALT
jgi:hypothetical protein